MQTTVSLTEVLNNIKLANNGYVFASSLSPEYLRRTEQLVTRGVAVKSILINSFGKSDVAYFTPESFMIYVNVVEKKSYAAFYGPDIDYEAKLLNRTEQYLSEC